MASLSSDPDKPTRRKPRKQTEARISSIAEVTPRALALPEPDVNWLRMRGWGEALPEYMRRLSLLITRGREKTDMGRLALAERLTQETGIQISESKIRDIENAYRPTTRHRRKKQGTTETATEDERRRFVDLIAAWELLDLMYNGQGLTALVAPQQLTQDEEQLLSLFRGIRGRTARQSVMSMVRGVRNQEMEERTAAAGEPGLDGSDGTDGSNQE